MFWASPTAASTGAADSPSPALPAQTGQRDLRKRSDADLTTMASNWDGLDAATRRTLLKEMQRRMASARRARSGNRNPEVGQGVLQIRTERRFGRRVRQSDGSLVTIETRVVRVRQRAAATGQSVVTEVTADQRAAERFGLGFEQRSAARRVSVVPAGTRKSEGATLERAPQAPQPNP